MLISDWSSDGALPSLLHQAPDNCRKGNTRQLGNGRLMADRTGIDVVYDFRTDDLRPGGHGAPISGSYHHGLLKPLGAGSDTDIINLGRLANHRWAGKAGKGDGFYPRPGVGPTKQGKTDKGPGQND